MVNFAFNKAEDTAYANRYFWSRSPLVCIACLGFLGPLMLLMAAGHFDEVKDTEDWFYVDPSSKQAFVCERAKIGLCSGEYKASSSGTKCYNHHRDAFMTQEKAQAACEEDGQGATLAMPKTPEENADVYRMCGSGGTETPCWIGLKREGPGSMKWTWFDGSTLGASGWSNWHENEITDEDPKENEDAAAIGFKRWAEAVAFAFFIGAVMGCVYVACNVAVVLGVCICIYMALSGASKNDSLIMVAAIADAYCGFWLCIGLSSTLLRVAGASGEAGGMPTDIFSIIFGLIEIVLLCALAFCGFQLRNKIQEEKTRRMNSGQGYAGGQVVGQVVGQPVQGTIVVAGAAPKYQP